MIELLHCGYTVDAKPILHDISVRLDGQRTAILGSNGSGKTTLARLLNGLLLPTEGVVNVFGVATGRDVKAARRKVGLVFQDADSQIVMPTVEEDLAFGLENLRLPKKEIAARVQAWLERFELVGKRHQSAYLLSGGEKKLLSILSVLIMEPLIVVFDEPFSSLDLINKKRIASLIDSLPQPVIMITHDVRDIAHFDRALCLENGRIIAEGRQADVVKVYMETMSACSRSTVQGDRSFIEAPPV